MVEGLSGDVGPRRLLFVIAGDLHHIINLLASQWFGYWQRGYTLSGWFLHSKVDVDIDIVGRNLELLAVFCGVAAHHYCYIISTDSAECPYITIRCIWYSLGFDIAIIE